LEQEHFYIFGGSLLINVTLAIASQIDIFTLISDLSLDKYLSVANSIIFQ